MTEDSDVVDATDPVEPVGDGGRVLKHSSTTAEVDVDILTSLGVLSPPLLLPRCS